MGPVVDVAPAVVAVVTEELELGAVPAEDTGYGEAVTDEEFAEWVRRSQDETDIALEEWDASVRFDMRREPDPAPLEVDEEGEGEFVDPDPDEEPNLTDVFTSANRRLVERFLHRGASGRVIQTMPRQQGRSWFANQVRAAEDSMAEALQEAMRSDLAVTCARRNLEAAGFQVMDVTDETVTLPRRALVPEIHRRGYFVSDLDVQAAQGTREESSTRSGLILPTRTTAPELRFSIVSYDSITWGDRPYRADFRALRG
jgi:hypothetical protein